MLSWLYDLSKAERKTMVACFGGWALDALDAQVFTFVIPSLLIYWGISKAQAGILATSTLLVSALGGWLAGALSDRIGRVRVLQITIIWYAVCTFLCGFTQNFEQLLIFRALQGLGFGGEWAAGSVLIGEVIRDKYRGRAGGLVQSGWAVGWGAAALLYTTVFTVLPEAEAWRALFWLGIAPAFLVFWVRRNVQDPELYRAKGAGSGAGFAQMYSVLRRPYLGATLKVWMMVAGAQAGSYSILIWLPTYLKTARDLSVQSTGGFLIVHILGALAGYIWAAYSADYLGRKRTFIFSALASIVLLLIYMFAPIDNTMLLLLGAPLGFFTYGMFAPMGPFMTELFPTRVRGCGQGFCYNAGRAVASLFPALSGLLAERIGLGAAIAIFGIAAYMVMILALLTLPETLGRPLDSIIPAEGAA